MVITVDKGGRNFSSCFSYTQLKKKGVMLNHPDPVYYLVIKVCGKDAKGDFHSG